MSTGAITSHGDDGNAAHIKDTVELEFICQQLKGAEAMRTRLNAEVGGDYAVRFPAMARTLTASVASLRSAIATYVAAHPDAVSLLLSPDFAPLERQSHDTNDSGTA